MALCVTLRFVATWDDSAGGHLALLAGLTIPHVKAVVAWYPITDIAAMDEGTEEDFYSRSQQAFKATCHPWPGW